LLELLAKPLIFFFQLIGGRVLTARFGFGSELGVPIAEGLLADVDGSGRVGFRVAFFDNEVDGVPFELIGEDASGAFWLLG